MIQANTNNRWAQLSQGEKAELLGIYTRAGYNDLASIIAHYNSCGGKLKEDGGPEGASSGWNIGAELIERAKKKYLSNYADSGYMYSYPSNPIELLGYVISPYAKISEYGNYMLGALPKNITDARRALFAKNFGINSVGKDYENAIVESKYRPTVSSDQNAKYYTIPVEDPRARFEDLQSIIGTGKYDFGEDENGKYLSVYDKWDLAPFSGKGSDFSNVNPPEIYDRFYQSEVPEIYNTYSNPNADFVVGGASRMDFASGGKIHIKPENRGKFTALKKRTGHSASWFKAHGTPAQKKMAVFALNARKWNHADGGPLGEENEIQVNHIPNWTVFGTDYSTWKPSDIQNIIDWGYTDPESFFGEEGENTRNALSRAGMADSVIGDIYANMDPELQSKFGDRYKGTKQRQQEYIGGITNAIDSAGQRIYQIADTVAGFVPGPVGMIDWLGHMGADAVEGEFGKVGKDLALAAGIGFGARALGKGARYLKNYWDEIGNFGEDTFRSFIDGVPGRVSTNFTYAAPATRAIAKAVPAVSKAVSIPYEIENLGGGYMLKSLMRGNPLEKQIGKNGTVNVNNIKALVGKGSKVEQAVVDKVLASEEFAGRKSIDYNKFRKAVQDELIIYNRTPDTRWEDYGMNGLGLHDFANPDYAAADDRTNALMRLIKKENLPWYIDEFGHVVEKNSEPGILRDYIYDEDIDKMFPGWLEKYKNPTERPQTFTFSSPRIPVGSDKHYDVNTLGHSRTYTTADEPDVLHIMESQSDWAQEGVAKRLQGRYFDKDGNDVTDLVKASWTRHDYSGEEWTTPEGFFGYDRRVQTYGRTAAEQEEFDKLAEKWIEHNRKYPTGFHPDGTLAMEFVPIQKRMEEIVGGIENANMGVTRPSIHLEKVPASAQEQYLSDNFTSRQIQENLRYAAEKGQTKMRYPTRDTAAKIEGYSKSRPGVFELEPELRIKYDDFMASRQQKVNDIIRESAPEGYIDDYLQRWEEIPDEAIEAMDEAQKADLKRRSKLSWDFEKSEAGKKMKDDINRVYREYDERKWLEENVPETYLPQHETILRKYDAFPKQYQKLYKGADIRTVTDPKGNTWYEVDVPENYLQQEWAYKNGGKLQQYADFSGFF